ncbi:hypothetical protein ACTMUQ_40755 [Streptomyces sp. SD11]|uniref:hypothetical protein n=1 Tax=Streptomyces sp. SD11 TaxID=3452209 RepID=UPI003F8BB9EB
MATVTTTRPRLDPRKLRLALSAVALAVALGSSAFSPASAQTGEHQAIQTVGTVQPLALSGPWPSWNECNISRDLMIYYGYDTTPCFRDPQGWFFQYF